MSQSQPHVLVPTHTARHLRPTLLALAASENPPATVVISVDGRVSEITEIVASVPWNHATRVLLVMRPHQGQARLNQVRNNGLRALAEIVHPADSDALIVIDGDVALSPDAIAAHLRCLRAGADVVLASRADLSPEQTEELTRLLGSGDVMRIRAAMQAAWSDAWPARNRRQRRLERQQQLRRWPLLGPLLCKPHKPKLLGGHHAVRWRTLIELNGYDERFVGYGYDDDDLARRLHAAGAQPAVAVDSIPAFHLWHPTRAPTRPVDAPGFATFRQPWQPRAILGVAHGSPQPAPTITVIREPTRTAASDTRETA